MPRAKIRPLSFAVQLTLYSIAPDITTNCFYKTKLYRVYTNQRTVNSRGKIEENLRGLLCHALAYLMHPGALLPAGIPQKKITTEREGGRTINQILKQLNQVNYFIGFPSTCKPNLSPLVLYRVKLVTSMERDSSS